MSKIGRIHSFESFGAVDGPGVRFVVFMQGCPFRCLYCHNPDTWSFFEGQQFTAEEVIAKAIRFKEYWGKDGGITVSGGEPLAQIDFLIELFQEAKKRNISTCIDTSGATFTHSDPFFSSFQKLMDLTDLLLVDIKHIDEEKHLQITSASSKSPRELLEYLALINKPVWIRYVLVPGLSDDPDDLGATRLYIDSLHNVQKVEVLPYHDFGAYKYEKLGIPYALKGIKAPSPLEIAKAEEILGAGPYKKV